MADLLDPNFKTIVLKMFNEFKEDAEKVKKMMYEEMKISMRGYKTYKKISEAEKYNS